MPFQRRVLDWMMATFSMEICRDRQERNHRFLEEALELVQACGCSTSEAHQLVDYVYGRDQGDINQEIGGVMVTLAALCLANDIDMHEGGEIELARIMQPGIMEKIRAKQASKPKHSPLPQDGTKSAAVMWQWRFRDGNWSKWINVEGDLEDFKKCQTRGLSKGSVELRALYAHPQEPEAVRVDANAIRAAAIEECAKTADKFTCGICGMDGAYGAAIRAIRALISQQQP
jgi:NTP pyrophosphatase (non-canonical NTP hydrolase)